MFVALRQMVEQLPGGEVVTRYPGQQLVTFDSWPYNNKVAAISARLVAKAADGEDVDAGALIARGPDPDTKAELARQHGWDKRHQVALLPPELALPPAVTDVASPSAPAAADATQAAADELLAQEDPELAAALGLAPLRCPDCDFVGATAQGLKVHRARAHKAD